MSELNIKVRKLQDNGSTFKTNPDTLYLGGVRSAKVDRLCFEVPEEWNDCTVTLHVQRLSGTLPDPQVLDDQNSVLVDRRWTLEKEGTWMLLAINADGYIAMTKPGKYTCYETIDTDSTTENLTPSIYEQFVAEVTKYAKQALESMNAAKASEEAAAKSAAEAANSAASMEESVRVSGENADKAEKRAAAAKKSEEAAAKSAEAAGASEKKSAESESAAKTSEEKAKASEEAAKRSEEASALSETHAAASEKNAGDSEAAAKQALQDTQDTRTAALTDISTARSTTLNDIATARTVALNDVAASTKTAETAATTATEQASAAAGSANKAAGSANEAASSAGAAKGDADRAEEAANNAANAAMDALQKAKDAGDFKGDKGDTGPQGPKGDPGDSGQWELLEKITLRSATSSVERTFSVELSALKVLFQAGTSQAQGTLHWVCSTSGGIQILSGTAPCTASSAMTSPITRTYACFQALPSFGQYLCLSASSSTGTPMAAVLPADNAFQTVDCSQKIGQFVLTIDTNVRIASGAMVELWGVRV